MAKTCCRCGISYENPAVAFARDPQKRDGIYSSCRSCKRSSENARYHADLEVGRGHRRAWYLRNRERRSAETLAYHKAHPEQHLAQVKRWQAANPEKVREWGRASHRNRTARKRQTNGRVTARDIAALLTRQAGQCYWCDGALAPEKTHLDHVLPLALGGEHSIQNAVLACSDCNQRKQAKHPAAFNAERWDRFQRERAAA